MKIMFLGAPGAGKGTQSEVIAKHFGIPTISTGDIIRNELKSGSELGIKMKSYTDKGHLVPDEIVIEIVKKRVSQDDCKNGFILDGFPRTIAQAEALDKNDIKLDFVFDIDVTDELIYNRMSGRRVCKSCGKTYNVNTEMKPKVDGVCDSCKGTLIQRADDNVDTVKERLKVYEEQTLPLKDYYEKIGKRIVLDGMRPLEMITDEIISHINA